MKSILQDEKECFLCGSQQWLEKHHVFGGGNRRLSEKHGLTVFLCHECHNEPPCGVHFSAVESNKLKAIAEKRWVEVNEKSKEEFIKIFGRNYI